MLPGRAGGTRDVSPSLATRTRLRSVNAVYVTTRRVRSGRTAMMAMNAPGYRRARAQGSNDSELPGRGTPWDIRDGFFKIRLLLSMLDRF